MLPVLFKPFSLLNSFKICMCSLCNSSTTFIDDYDDYNDDAEKVVRNALAARAEGKRRMTGGERRDEALLPASTSALCVE